MWKFPPSEIRADGIEFLGFRTV